MKQKLLLLCMALLVSVCASAYDFESDGIYYNKNSDGNTVAVTNKEFHYKSYSGAVNIPSTVTYNGTTYSVTVISICAFYPCNGLTSVTIPNSVTSIGREAFSGCSGLTEVTIPNSVTEIGIGAFEYCYGLAAFYGKYASTDNRCLIIDGVLNSFAPSGLSSYDIPNSVTSIGYSAFSGCTGLTSVTIPNSVTEIGQWAFRGCTGLTSVTIGNSVTSIDWGAFGRCSGLAKIYAHPVTPPTCDSDVFVGMDKNTCILYVPNESVEDYKAADQWKDFYNIEGADFSGIETVYAEGADNLYKVYDLNGILRMVTEDESALQNLPAGIYIINGKKMIVR